MIDPGRRPERRAELFEELASTLEAGLSIDAAFAAAAVGSVAHPGEPVTRNLQAALADLDPVDLAVLSAGEHQGGLPRALRARAERHRHRARTRREILKRLAYPSVLVIAVVLLWAWLEFLGFGAPLAFGAWWFGMLGGVAIALLILHRRARRVADSHPEKWPVVGGLYRNSAAVPYLESLGGLLGAGVRIDEAHERALRTVPWAGPRARLFAAGQALAQGETFATALRDAAALDDETQRALHVAEQSGDLEATAIRLATRRTEHLEREIGQACRIAGAIAYVGAATLAIVTIANFYGGIATGRLFR